MNPTVIRMLLRLRDAATLTVKDATSVDQLNALKTLTKRGFAIFRSGRYEITHQGMVQAARESLALAPRAEVL